MLGLQVQILLVLTLPLHLLLPLLSYGCLVHHYLLLGQHGVILPLNLQTGSLFLTKSLIELVLSLKVGSCVQFLSLDLLVNTMLNCKFTTHVSVCHLVETCIPFLLCQSFGLNLRLVGIIVDLHVSLVSFGNPVPKIFLITFNKLGVVGQRLRVLLLSHGLHCLVDVGRVPNRPVELLRFDGLLAALPLNCVLLCLQHAVVGQSLLLQVHVGLIFLATHTLVVINLFDDVILDKVLIRLFGAVLILLFGDIDRF
jgi:hypothetical protein